LKEFKMNHKAKILVTDDDPDVLLLFTSLLADEGYEVYEASTGETCLDIARTRRPDLILLDVLLPDVTGVEVCKEIKASPGLKDTFVILLSGARVSSEYQADGLDVGADGYIVKGLTNREFLARIHSLVRIKRAEDALRVSEARYRRLFETAQDGIIILDADTEEISDVNPFLIDMLGYSHEEMLGKRLSEIGTFESVEAGKRVCGELQRAACMRQEDLPLRTKDGRELIVQLLSNTCMVDHRKIVQINIRDVTERKQLEERLQNMASRDELTGLHNRRGFFALSQQQLQIAERAKKAILLFFADLDNMKRINDTLGHQEGDSALVEIADVLKVTFRKSDIIARMGGDEFAVLAVDAMDDSGYAIGRRLQNTLEARSRSKAAKYALSLSTGVARFDPENPSSLDELLAMADRSMYEQKRARRN
jgi:diguanylate cyclase (GGDEF)-like protein/PAS domain S-box-containing protein